MRDPERAERITLILLTEKERLELREDITRTYGETGDPLLYLMPPCIVLGKASEITRRIALPERFGLTSETGANEWGSFMRTDSDGLIAAMQETLGLPVIPTGLHISSDPSSRTLLTEVKSVRAYALAEAVVSDNTFRVIRQKRL